MAALVQARIAAQRATIAKLTHEQAMLDAVAAFLKDYRFDAEPRTAPGMVWNVA